MFPPRGNTRPPIVLCVLFIFFFFFNCTAVDSHGWESKSWQNDTWHVVVPKKQTNKKHYRLISFSWREVRWGNEVKGYSPIIWCNQFPACPDPSPQIGSTPIRKDVIWLYQRAKMYKSICKHNPKGETPDATRRAEYEKNPLSSHFIWSTLLQTALEALRVSHHRGNRWAPVTFTGKMWTRHTDNLLSQTAPPHRQGLHSWTISPGLLIFVFWLLDLKTHWLSKESHPQPIVSESIYQLPEQKDVNVL